MPKRVRPVEEIVLHDDPRRARVAARDVHAARDLLEAIRGDVRAALLAVDGNRDRHIDAANACEDIVVNPRRANRRIRSHARRRGDDVRVHLAARLVRDIDPRGVVRGSRDSETADGARAAELDHPVHDRGSVELGPLFRSARRVAEQRHAVGDHHGEGLVLPIHVAGRLHPDGGARRRVAQRAPDGAVRQATLRVARAVRARIAVHRDVEVGASGRERCHTRPADVVGAVGAHGDGAVRIRDADVGPAVGSARVALPGVADRGNFALRFEGDGRGRRVEDVVAGRGRGPEGGPAVRGDADGDASAQRREVFLERTLPALFERMWMAASP